MKNIITGLFLLFTISTFAQTGIGTTTPNTNAQLEVASTTKGFLPPRVALTGTTSASPLAAHVAGMVVYNTATVSDVTPGLYVNNGSAWEKSAGGGASSINDLSDAKTSGIDLYLGNASGFSNITGQNNVAVGPYSIGGRYGSNNVAVGQFALTSNEGSSLDATLGSSNTALGYYSLINNATGSKNIAIGANAGEKISTGLTNNTSDNSIFIGVDTRPLGTTQTNQIVIGDAAVGNGSNTVTIGNSSITDNYFSGNVQSASFKVSALNTAPASATAAGTLGEIRVTATYIYVCTATDTWVRSALSTW